MADRSGTQGRILIVDHDADVVEPLDHYFREQGFDVLSTASIEEAVRLAARQRPSIILLAATLGGVDGIEVFRKIRGTPITAHIPVMFVADYRDGMRQNQLLAEGADDVIIRPFDVEILGLRVRNAIKRTQREGLTEPRTGLPTGALITEKLAEVQRQGRWVRLDLTIAHFDAFRARYDFITGNDVLRYAANTICEVVNEIGGSDDFVGHRRETEFVVITTDDRGQAIHDALQARLDEGLLQFYNFMEREQGYVMLEGGRGGQEQRPLMRVEIHEETGA
jgi:two-component system alkaline phosphatase synthesis response regulator PhoP